MLVKSAESQSKCRNIFVLLVSAGLHGGWKTGRGDAPGEGVGRRVLRRSGPHVGHACDPAPCDPAPCDPASNGPAPCDPAPIASSVGPTVASLLRGLLTLSGCSVELDELRSQSGSHNNCRVNYCSIFQEKQKALTFSKFHMSFVFSFWLWRPSVA